MSTTRVELDPVRDFALFADLLPEAMLLVDGEGRVLAANRRIGSLLGGLAADELIGRRLQDLTEDPPEKLSRWLRICARSRDLMPGVLLLRRGDGGLASLRAAGAACRPAAKDRPALILVRLVPKNEAVGRFMALNLRIEELSAQVVRRRRAEIALDEEREWLRVTLASIGDAVIATDDRGRVTFLNPVAEKLTGWTQEEAQGHALDEVFVLVNEHTLQSVESPVARVLREGAVVGLANHTILIARDGTRFPIDDSGAPIRDEQGTLVGVVLVFHDVTERRDLERQLEARNRNLLEADRRKDEFLAMLAHELRNPLAPLRSGTQILRTAGADEQTVAQVAGMMDRQVTHLTRLVDDLLDVSRITRGRIELHREEVTIQSILDHALEMVSQEMRDPDHDVSVRMPDAPLRIFGDGSRLAQVFSNLLSNAAKFTPPGGRIELAAEATDGALDVRIRDDGIGIEPGLLSEIFELFTQADRSLERSHGGLGLGLTVARQVVEMHGGRIVAHSEGLGRGSEFSVVLPLDESAPGSAPPAEASQRRSSARRVLVVDDNRDAAESLATLIRLWGHEVRVAENGHRALEIAAEQEPHVVLLDIGLPGIDGFEVAQRLREQPGLRGVRLVAVTGYGRDEDRRAAAEAGFDAHLTKPVEPERIAELLR